MSNEAKKAPTLVEMLELIKRHAEGMESMMVGVGDEGVNYLLADESKAQALEAYMSLCAPSVIRQACEIALDELTGDRVARALSAITYEAYERGSKLESVVRNDTDELFYHVVVTPITKEDAQKHIERVNKLAADSDATLINYPAPTHR